MSEKMRKIFLENSKKVTCPECGRTFRIENYRRRPAKDTIHSKHCLNPLGITVTKS
jgi:hypothetical protein